MWRCLCCPMCETGLDWACCGRHRYVYPGDCPPVPSRNAAGWLRGEASSRPRDSRRQLVPRTWGAVHIPAGDTAPGPRGHAAAAATAALSIWTPRIPVIWTGNLMKRPFETCFMIEWGIGLNWSLTSMTGGRRSCSVSRSSSVFSAPWNNNSCWATSAETRRRLRFRWDESDSKEQELLQPNPRNIRLPWWFRPLQHHLCILYD